MKRLIALVLACLMLATFFVSCEKDDVDPDNGDYLPAEDPYEKDDLPELNYGGENVTMLYWSDRVHKEEFEITEPSDDLVVNASYKRTKTTEQRLGIKFGYASCVGNASGDNTAKFIAFWKKDISYTPRNIPK